MFTFYYCTYFSLIFMSDCCLPTPHLNTVIMFTTQIQVSGGGWGEWRNFFSGKNVTDPTPPPPSTKSESAGMPMLITCSRCLMNVVVPIKVAEHIFSFFLFFFFGARSLLMRGSARTKIAKNKHGAH